MLSKENGANFSVPGSGKTAVALATHLLSKGVNGLLVVAPKNAFMAWDEQVEEIIDKSHPMRKKGLIRLTGTENYIRKQIFITFNNKKMNLEILKNLI